jgi:putative endonuclease
MPSRLRRDHPDEIEVMFVYILFSEQRGRYYVGQTASIIERLKRHNQGRVSSTKTGIPWKVVLQIEVLDRSESLILERRIKKRGAKRYIDDQFGV